MLVLSVKLICGPIVLVRARFFLLSIAIVCCGLAACKNDAAKSGDATEPPSSDSATPETQGVTPSATRFPPGTVALFDIERGTGENIDLGTAALRAAWIEDGETVLILDAYTGKYLVMNLDGSVVGEVADSRYTTGYEPHAVIDVRPVRDQQWVAVADFESRRMTLVSSREWREEIVRDDAFVQGQFSPGGQWLAGSVSGIGPDGLIDEASTLVGIFAREGTCGDSRPYACLEWTLPQDTPGEQRFFAYGDAWAPDGNHILVQRRPICPEQTPGTPPIPCTPETTFEVYAWPSRDLVFSKEAGQFGEIEWAGAGQLRVDRESILSLDGTLSALPEGLRGCCVSFSPDGRYAVDSVIPGEDCSLIEVATGAVIASVPAGDGDTNDTGICQFVSWTADGSMAIATGVNTP